MHTSLISLLSLAPLVSRVAGSPCQAAPPTAKALYLITNDEENAVVAMSIQADGTIGAADSATRTVTMGAGANGLDGMNQPAVPDSLFSQSALTVVGNTLFAVNPGSNSLSMFTIDEADPTKLTIVCEPLALPGEFPVTVAASGRDGIVCVGFSGAKAGVSCASFSEDGMGDMDALRPFELNQSTPPVGPLNTVSQVFFSEDGATLFSTVKGDPNVNNTGFLASFPVDEGGVVSQTLTTDSPPGTAVLFGTNVIPGTQNVFATDASFGGAVLDVSKLGEADVLGTGAIDGQMATCWVAVSRASNTAWVSDVGVDRLVEMSLTDASIVSTLDLSSNGDPGLIDLAAAGNFVYALSPGNGTTPATVTVVSAVSKQQIQHQDIQSLGVGPNAMGMVVSF